MTAGPYRNSEFLRSQSPLSGSRGCLSLAQAPHGTAVTFPATDQYDDGLWWEPAHALLDYGPITRKPAALRGEIEDWLADLADAQRPSITDLLIIPLQPR
ncbi:hypothetical protein [Wenjunlia tyrosinilytica]|uniref:hypothetical protein n=1 Tax=Wenjunlia tyrosinilytica TaxID=1544741 RepID=UPI001668E81B|nr:hypothetical protein [Wenjunlia tyrosinilytica]